MHRYLILFSFNFLFIINTIGTESINELLPHQSDSEQNKNLKLKIALDSVRLKISDGLYLECPVGRLKPATFMFVRKDAVDFVSRFSIQLNDTFESIKKRRKDDMATFLTNELNTYDQIEERAKKDKVLLHCKWISSDLSQEYGNFTLHLNRPKDNVQLNNYLYKYFDSKQDHSRDVPTIAASTNKILKRKIGDKVNFFCNLNQPIEAKITWYRKDEHDFINLNNEMRTNQHALDILNYRITSNRLTIKELGRSDFAEYVCKASNDYGEDFAFYKLEMLSSKKSLEPKITLLEDVSLRENRSVMLNCSIASYEKFSVQWFEKFDCKRDCDDKYEFIFIANGERYRPLLNENTALASHNKIQYLATYFLDKPELVNRQKYLCMVRNQNGMNYKIMTLTVDDKVTDRFLRFFDNSNVTTIAYLTSAAAVILLITLILVIVLMRKSKNKPAKDQQTNLNNNLTTLNRTRSQNDYLNAPHRSKAFNEKTLKNSTFMINNLIQTGRASNLTNIDNLYSSQYLHNKYNRSKLSSFSNSFQRLNNTPVPDDALSYQNV